MNFRIFQCLTKTRGWKCFIFIIFCILTTSNEFSKFWMKSSVKVFLHNGMFGVVTASKLHPKISTDVMAAIVNLARVLLLLYRKKFAFNRWREQSHCDANYSPFCLHDIGSILFEISYDKAIPSLNQPFFNASTIYILLIRILVWEEIYWWWSGSAHLLRFSPLFVVGVLCENRLILRIPSIMFLTKNFLFFRPCPRIEIVFQSWNRPSKRCTRLETVSFEFTYQCIKNF